jgi:hypothetical protein
VTFARHVGNLEAALYVLGIPCDPPQGVLPQAWQKAQGFSVTNHLPAGYAAMPKTTPEQVKARRLAHDKAKREHKAAIRDAMARRYPHLTVTLETADALGILTWAMARCENVGGLTK